MAGGQLGTALRQLGRLLDEGGVTGLEDDQLLDRFAVRRDGAAFEALVARHGPMVLATCRGVLKDSHAAEDAFQATFLALARKAGSLRSGKALGSWLHRVARRVSVEANIAAARRRGREAPGLTTEPLDRRAAPLDEDWPILHEEIDRLPERYRAPIVLCYLEGMTHEQAAGHLRWPVGTVGGRLARARELMRGRLLRRGVTASLAGLAATPKLARATVPERLARATVVAATGGITSAGAMLMAELMVKGMLVTKLKMASTAALAALTLALGGLVVARAGLPEASKVEPAQAPSAPLPAGKSPAGESVRVVDPDGRPVPGARVYQSPTRFRSYDRVPFAALKLAETGPDGVFPLASDLAKAATDHELNIVAMVDGYGPAFGFGPAFADPAVVVDGMKRLQLVRDDVPIRGRVLDIEGRPVAGASVQLVGIRWPLTGTLDEWLAVLKAEKEANTTTNRLLRSWSSDDIPPLFPGVTTDAKGRFTLQGVGRERVAMLVISGPGIETRFENVATRDMPTVSYPPYANRAVRPAREILFHGASFELVAGPGLEVVGTVRDKDAGRPLPGIAVQTAAPFGNPIRNLKTITDAEGRYRLAGVASKDDYGQEQGVLASSKDGPPYLGTVQPVGEGRGTITRDFALKRGVWARGRVIDQSTGLPVMASVNYFIPEDNPHLKDYPPYGSVRLSPGLEADEHGEFKLVVIPGRGILAARFGNGVYRMGVGGDKIAGMKPSRPGMHPFLPAQPVQLSPQIFNTLIEIRPKEGDESVAVDIALDRGRTVRGTLVGPDGEPVVGASMLGANANERWSLRPLPSAEFEVRSLGPDGKRGLIFSHEAKNLAGAYVVQPDEEGPLTIRLQPCGTWTGRLVDDEGRPLAGTEIRCNSRSPINFDDSRFEQGSLPRSEPIRTDKEGRFRVSGIVPGLKYTFFVLKDRRVGLVVNEGVAAPGEVKDLGDIRPQPPGKPGQ